MDGQCKFYGKGVRFPTKGIVPLHSGYPVVSIKSSEIRERARRSDCFDSVGFGELGKFIAAFEPVSSGGVMEMRDRSRSQIAVEGTGTDAENVRKIYSPTVDR